MMTEEGKGFKKYRVPKPSEETPNDCAGFLKVPKVPTFTAHYEFEGSSWSIDFPAESWEDAERRIEAIKRTLTIDGQNCGTISADKFN
jgi:hypothetical protein